jgi:hypothetical protein
VTESELVTRSVGVWRAVGLGRCFHGGIARDAPRAAPFWPTRGAAAGFWRFCWGAQRTEEGGKGAAHPTGRDPAFFETAFPGQAEVSNQRTRQAELRIGCDHRPGPAIRLFGMTQAWKRPIEGLLEKAKGMLEIEATGIGTPDHGKIGDSGTAPPQPQQLRFASLLGQATHLDQEHGASNERSGSTCPLGRMILGNRVQSLLCPHPHLPVLQILTRILIARLRPGCGISAGKLVTMPAWAPRRGGQCGVRIQVEAAITTQVDEDRNFICSTSLFHIHRE